MNILIVLTSHQNLGTTTAKTGLWLDEFTVPYYLFKDNNATVTLASPLGRQVPIDHQRCKQNLLFALKMILMLPRN